MSEWSPFGLSPIIIINNIPTWFTDPCEIDIWRNFGFIAWLNGQSGQDVVKFSTTTFFPHPQVGFLAMFWIMSKNLPLLMDGIICRDILYGITCGILVALDQSRSIVPFKIFSRLLQPWARYRAKSVLATSNGDTHWLALLAYRHESFRRNFHC